MPGHLQCTYRLPIRPLDYVTRSPRDQSIECWIRRRNVTTDRSELVKVRANCSPIPSQGADCLLFIWRIATIDRSVHWLNSLYDLEMRLEPIIVRPSSFPRLPASIRLHLVSRAYLRRDRNCWIDDHPYCMDGTYPPIAWLVVHNGLRSRNCNDQLLRIECREQEITCDRWLDASRSSSSSAINRSERRIPMIRGSESDGGISQTRRDLVKRETKACNGE